MNKWPAIRDALLFLSGIAGVAHETILQQGAERPTLLILFAAMMGLPAFLQRPGGGSRGDDEDKRGG